MNFIDAIKYALRIIQLDEKAMDFVSKCLDALKWAILIIVIGGVASAIGFHPGGFSLKALILTPIGFLIFAVVGIFLLYIFLNYILKISIDPVMLFKPIAFASIVSWLSILGFIPFLGKLIVLLAFLWNIIVTIFIVEKVANVDRKNAVLSIVFVLVVFFIIDLILGSTFNIFV